MSRLIDVDTLRKNIQYVFDTGEEVTKYGLRIVLSILDKTPTVDIERHGHWIDNGKYWYVCSVCDYVEPLSDLMDAHYKYCPNCGAKMDEVEE